MSAIRAGRAVLASAAASVAALALVAGGSVLPASAEGPPGPTSRPESSPPPDPPSHRLPQPSDGQLALTASDTRTIPQRLAAAGADPALGSRVSAVVLDATTGAVIYSRNSSLALMPASNQKLVTAFVAISTMARDKTLTTQVRTNASRNTVWLVGGGDPALWVTKAREMAGTTRSALVAAGVRTVAVRVDDTLFPPPTNATGWKPSYLPGDVVPVRPLVVGGRNAMDTGLDAGVIFANELKRLGIGVSSTIRGKVPTGAPTIVSATSPYIGTLTANFINTSDNDYAENIHRHSSLTVGKGATWTAANAHALAVLKARGVNTTGVAVHDGSGLSRSDRASAATMTSLLLRAKRDAAVAQVFNASTSMPTAGVSGSLRTRFATADTQCARGKVRAKTGWLSDAIALSGTAYGVDGRERIFSIIENGAADPTAARLAIERFATAATGCNPA
ncbi:MULTISPECIES: D-alanyl-D-alanine carboxypeptidase/D-alanyl-D-alanine-endopeptidase [unclassified Knoellia]|uniref:D-alanyl-D-alanine carboxypeptidase/D-alanyl-D-alanine-endopeptidase n=1 Tax=Knoellia altitudinis TaxID=3404795 RepID=UPI00361FF0EC